MSIVPPPVWVKPCRLGVTCPCRSLKMMDTGGADGAAGLTVMVTGVLPAVVPSGHVDHIRYSFEMAAKGRS